MLIVQVFSIGLYMYMYHTVYTHVYTCTLWCTLMYMCFCVCIHVECVGEARQYSMFVIVTGPPQCQLDREYVNFWWCNGIIIQLQLTSYICTLAVKPISLMSTRDCYSVTIGLRHMTPLNGSLLVLICDSRYTPYFPPPPSVLSHVQWCEMRTLSALF